MFYSGKPKEELFEERHTALINDDSLGCVTVSRVPQPPQKDFYEIQCGDRTSARETWFALSVDREWGFPALDVMQAEEEIKKI